MAYFSDESMNSAAARNPARLAVVLNGFGGAAIILAILFFGGSFYVENEIGRAFCLGAFFSGLLGGIVLFGFAKIIDMLDSIRQQTLADQEDGVPVSGTGSNAPAGENSPNPAA